MRAHNYCKRSDWIGSMSFIELWLCYEINSKEEVEERSFTATLMDSIILLDYSIIIDEISTFFCSVLLSFIIIVNYMMRRQETHSIIISVSSISFGSIEQRRSYLVCLPKNAIYLFKITNFMMNCSTMLYSYANRLDMKIWNVFDCDFAQVVDRQRMCIHILLTYLNFQQLANKITQPIDLADLAINWR